MNYPSKTTETIRVNVSMTARLHQQALARAIELGFPEVKPLSPYVQSLIRADLGISLEGKRAALSEKIEVRRQTKARARK
jgi:hypothetical protein